ncbi:MAG TPA: T9SS type A sorting domain-containing protein [Candidatus Marinimicrobia bacterium]|nr:T9SS type A sorting domain-containing protein [Candidatus Neomarinimicrobiota bacterium]
MLKKYLDKLELFENLLIFPRDIAIKELENTPLSDADYENIYCFGRLMQYLSSDSDDPFELWQTNTDEESGQPTIPEKFQLYQNFPNLFNPQTTIAFDLPEKSHIRQEIYNLLGQRISVLADDFLHAGRYQFVWNGKDHQGNKNASGIYFYRLVTNENIQFRKMILVR